MSEYPGCLADGVSILSNVLIALISVITFVIGLYHDKPTRMPLRPAFFEPPPLYLGDPAIDLEAPERTSTSTSTTRSLSPTTVLEFAYDGDDEMPNESRAKNWCFTLNNYLPEDETRLQSLVDTNDKVAYVIYGREVGEGGTHHLQGFIAFTERTRFGQARQVVGGGAHLESARSVPRSIEYCKKDGDYVEFGELSSRQGSRSDLDAFKEDVKAGVTDLAVIRETHSEVYARYTRFCLEYIQDHYPRKELVTHQLNGWQEDLNQRLNRAPDDRTITFVVDIIGNSGKTWFAHYYASLHDDVQVLPPGKKADMAFALNPTIRVLFIDAPRSKQGEFIQYDFLEDVKNGYVFSTKYESRVKTLSRVHVCVLMNELPDRNKLSADRYDIVEITN